ncbi:MAG: hypothetical protein BWZ02_02240 [Lentisphaerae bacterium ADurb.BinA184]|nr:MAG: hypothetical protein BWZ02_02240 [Lentisphaerae bacterium ADurb.BinA184]
MKYLHRQCEDKLRAYARSFPCVLVVGARQVGKSTLLAHLFGAGRRAFTFDPVQDIYGVRTDPDLFLRNNPPPLILDEIQAGTVARPRDAQSLAIVQERLGTAAAPALIVYAGRDLLRLNERCLAVPFDWRVAAAPRARARRGRVADHGS